VNNSGVVVGFYHSQTGFHGFVLFQGAFTTVDFPGAVLTNVFGINDSGQLVGRFQTEEGVDHGFVLSNGVFRQIDFPGSISTQCHGINKKGQIVGRYFNVENSGQGGGGGLGREHGFLLSANGFSSIDFPGADTTDAWKITDRGDIIGDWSTKGALQSGSLHGYIIVAGQYSSFDFPYASGTAGRDLDASGHLVGVLYDKKCVPLGHGFVRINGSYDSFDFPGSACTTANGLNNSGLIVGAYTDSSGAQHGYAAQLER
jgi:probable HAF family extracellular repeat protein